MLIERGSGVFNDEPKPIVHGSFMFSCDQFDELAGRATQHANERTRMATSISLEQAEIIPIQDQRHEDVEHDRNGTPRSGRSDREKVAKNMVSAVRGAGAGVVTQQRGKRERVENKHRHDLPAPAGSSPLPLPRGPPPMRLIRRGSYQERAALR